MHTYLVEMLHLFSKHFVRDHRKKQHCAALYLQIFYYFLIMLQTMTSRYTDGQIFIYVSARARVNSETTKSRMKSSILGILSTLTRQRKRTAGVRAHCMHTDLRGHIHMFYIHSFGMAVVGRTRLYC